MAKEKQKKRRSCGNCEACTRLPCGECNFCKRPELNNRCELRRCHQKVECAGGGTGQPQASREESKVEAAKSKEGGRTSELTSERSGIERGSIMREPGSKNSHRKMESNRTLLKVTYEKTTKPREDGKTQCLEDNSNRDNAANKVTIDKEKLRRMLGSDDERSSSSYEGRADIEHKKSKTHKLDISSCREDRSKTDSLKESRVKGAKPNHTDKDLKSPPISKPSHLQHRHFKSHKTEVSAAPQSRVKPNHSRAEADSSTDAKGSNKTLVPSPHPNSDIWKGIPSPSRILSQEPGPVNVPPFEATGLNDDIWADVHKGMVEIADVLNSTTKSWQLSSSSKRDSSVARRNTGAGS